MRWRVGPLVALNVLLSWQAVAEGAEGVSTAQKAAQVSQSALGQALPDLAFTRIDGRMVKLSEYRGKPLLVTLVYTSCVDVCPTLIENLYPAVAEARRTLGPDSFSVITVGFDVGKDTPQRMRAFASAHGADLPNWAFLSADEENLDRLARSVGFAYYGRAGTWDHLAQVSVIDADGRLRQQIYGAVFEPPLIVEPLKSLVFGRDLPLASLGSLIDRVKFFCTVYDPSSGRYYFNYSLFLNIAIGFLCFGRVLGMLMQEWRRGSGSRPS